MVVLEKPITEYLSWNETKIHSNFVRQQGAKQFLNVYNESKHRDGDTFKWGDEIEYMLIKFDDANKVARLSFSDGILKNLHQLEEKGHHNDAKTLWCCEVGRYMLESAPAQPFDDKLSSLGLVEASMRGRRQEIAKYLAEDECMMTLTSFPRLGTPGFTWPMIEPQPNKVDSLTQSVYYPDEAIHIHLTGYKVWTRNIRERRGEKVKITPLVFKDAKTQIPVEGAPADKPDAVYMDTSCFGFGCAALQVTFQGKNLAETRTMYDQLGVLAPIMLALTAAAPAFRGYLLDTDTRWNVLSESGDCRTAGERGEAPLKENERRIPKSRYASIDLYLSAAGEKYNDTQPIYDESIYNELRDGGVDHLLAKHIANILIRDPLYAHKETSIKDYDQKVYYYNLLLSTNWRSLRFKEPTVNPDCGWRVEFRPCEVQLTDFDNAAIACFMTLLTRVILSQKLNFLIPMSKVDENFETAQKRNACHAERFWFRKNIFSDQTNDLNNLEPADDEFGLMTMNEIFNGNGSSFPGLIPLINKYLLKMDVDAKTNQTLQRYLQFIQGRASGQLLTIASWMRQEITNHPEYKNDSVVSERINFNLMKKVREIQEGKRTCSELYGALNITEN